MRVQDEEVMVRFYLMEGLPRPFLLGYPWMSKYGEVVDARKGIFTIEDLNVTVELERQKDKSTGNTTAVFAAFGVLRPATSQQQSDSGEPSYLN